jgi:hypothetical protein
MTPGIPFITGADHPLNGYVTSVTSPNPTEPVPIQTESMQMPADRPFLIDEIRAIVRVIGYDVRNEASINDGYTGPRAIGAGVELDLSLGPWRLTDGFTPLWMLSPPPNAYPAIANFGTAGLAYGGSPDDESIFGAIRLFPGTYPAPWNENSGLVYAHYTWRFAEPLVVPSNMMLTGAIRMNPAYGPVVIADVDNTEPIRPHCWLGFQGRMLPFDYKTPKQIKIPWASHWPGAPAGISGGAYFGNTQPSISGDRLINPFQKPLHVQRLLGRCVTAFTASSVGAVVPVATNTVIDTTPYRYADGGGRIVQVNVENAGQVLNMVLRERMHRVFGRFPYWTIGQALNTNDKISITLDPMQPTGAVPGDTISSYGSVVVGDTGCRTTPLFGINGWRMEDVA